MISVITGDIIGSKYTKPNIWLRKLKNELNSIGKWPKYWEIFRGDSFQVMIKDPKEALIKAIKLKAKIKTIKNVDIRMAIGIGDIDYTAKYITESNGSAFVYSGEKFDKLIKEKQTLAIQTKWADFDKETNLYLKLAMIVMDKWTVSVAEAVVLLIENRNLSQNEIGKLLNIKQSTVSARLSRAYIDELIEINNIYKEKLTKL